MTRISVDLVALAIACTSLVVLGFQSRTTLDEGDARTEAQSYLSASPQHAALVGERWAVSDGDDTAWLDARTGELVEIEFATAR